MQACVVKSVWIVIVEYLLRVGFVTSTKVFRKMSHSFGHQFLLSMGTELHYHPPYGFPAIRDWNHVLELPFSRKLIIVYIRDIILSLQNSFLWISIGDIIFSLQCSFLWISIFESPKLFCNFQCHLLLQMPPRSGRQRSMTFVQAIISKPKGRCLTMRWGVCFVPFRE